MPDVASFSIVIPIFNETDALRFSKFYFDRLDIKPVYALDSKKISRRREVEQLLSRSVAIYDNPGNYVEAHYERLTALSPTDWILRIDCDEVPNSFMLQHCEKFIRKPTDDVCGFDRDDLCWRDSRFQRLKHSPLFFDTQFRLFNRNWVRFLDKIHTPGFAVAKWKLPLVPLWHAPHKARIYHLQREFVSARENAEKQRRYNEEGQNPKFFEAMMKAQDTLRWRSFDDAAFTALFADWKASHPE